MFSKLQGRSEKRAGFSSKALGKFQKNSFIRHCPVQQDWVFLGQVLIWWNWTNKLNWISLVVQWLRLSAANAGVQVWSLVGELRSHMLWGAAKRLKKKKGLTNFCNLLGQNNVPDTERKKQLAFLHHRSWKVPGGRVRAGTGQSWEVLRSGSQGSWRPLWSQLEFERVEETRGQPRSGPTAGLWRSSGNFPETFSGGGEGLPWKPRS